MKIKFSPEEMKAFTNSKSISIVDMDVNDLIVEISKRNDVSVESCVIEDVFDSVEIHHTIHIQSRMI